MFILDISSIWRMKLKLIRTANEMYMDSFKWDFRFVELAEHFSTWSKDPSTRIGAVAVSVNRQILSIGWNGFPRGIADTEPRLNDRETKYKHVVHAEQNCIYNACHNGISLCGSSLFVYGLPVCGECSKAIVQVGVQRVVCGFDGMYKENWKESVAFAEGIFKEADIELTYYSRRENVWHQL